MRYCIIDGQEVTTEQVRSSVRSLVPLSSPPEYFVLGRRRPDGDRDTTIALVHAPRDEMHDALILRPYLKAGWEHAYKDANNPGTAVRIRMLQETLSDGELAVNITAHITDESKRARTIAAYNERGVTFVFNPHPSAQDVA